MAAFCVHASEIFLEAIETSENSSKLPIRVQVPSANYSFSTTPTGYYRYMSEIDGVDYANQKFGSACAYLVLAILNAIAAIIMFIRMIMMAAFTILGFVVVLLHLFGRQGSGFWRFGSWVKWYAIIASIQIIFAICVRVMLFTLF